MASWFKWVGVFCLLILNAYSPAAYSNEPWRPRRSGDLPLEVFHNDSVRVKNCRLVWVNYEAIQRDFPATRAWSEAQIDQWILDQASYVSRTQLRLAGVRFTRDFEFDANDVKADYRQAGWNRSGTIEMNVGNEVAGMVDLKGNGLSARQTGSAERQIRDFQSAHGVAREIESVQNQAATDGMVGIHNALEEVYKQQLVQRLADIDHAAGGPAMQTVDSYFVMEYPFRIYRDGMEIPAAAVGRQAHLGRVYSEGHGPILDGKTWGMQYSRSGAMADYGNVGFADARIRYEEGAPKMVNGQPSQHFDFAMQVAKEKDRTKRQAMVSGKIASLGSGLEADWQKARTTLKAKPVAVRPDMERIFDEAIDRVKTQRFRLPGMGNAQDAAEATLALASDWPEATWKRVAEELKKAPDGPFAEIVRRRLAYLDKEVKINPARQLALATEIERFGSLIADRKLQTEMQRAVRAFHAIGMGRRFVEFACGILGRKK
ncbi:MAG: hypothetical protein AB7P04_11510 [Bacteriovoracia bacterium]